jgi:hypothetical protein
MMPVLTMKRAGGINPRHVPFSRLQAVLSHVRANQSHLTTGFRAAHAVTPAQFRKKAGRA